MGAADAKPSSEAVSSSLTYFALTGGNRTDFSPVSLAQVPLAAGVNVVPSVLVYTLYPVITPSGQPGRYASPSMLYVPGKQTVIDCGDDADGVCHWVDGLLSTALVGSSPDWELVAVAVICCHGGGHSGMVAADVAAATFISLADALPLPSVAVASSLM